MFLKTMSYEYHQDYVDVTDWHDSQPRYVSGLQQVEINCSFIANAKDCLHIQEHFQELLDGDVVLVRRRIAKQGLTSPCPYCGGNPGIRRSCAGCGAPNFQETR